MSTQPAPKPWFTYLLRCRDGSLYAGTTTDAVKRIAAHNAGRGARYTRSRSPVALAWLSPELDKREAHRLEARLKKLTKAAKESLVRDGGSPSPPGSSPPGTTAR